MRNCRAREEVFEVGESKPFVEMFAVLDYIHGRRKELEGVILSQGRSERERREARERRDFLEGQHRIAIGGGRWRARLSRLDPVLVERVLEYSGSPSSGRDVPSETGAEPHPGDDRPSYWDGCENMSFRELLGFIDKELRALVRGDGNTGGGPVSEEDFLELLGLLRTKAGEGALAGKRPAPVRGPGPREGFAPSEELLALRDECARLRAEAKRLGRGAGARERSASFYRRRAERCQKRADAWEDEERRERGLRSHAGSSGRRGEPPASAAHPPDLSGTVRRVRRDIERAFRPDGPLAPPGDLPWELLPPGQLTREGVRAHYERLARAYPERGYLPERMVEAHSLGPRAWWKGRKGFYGYVVFEFAGTEKVLLECPVYGNAIYVLGGDWRELSRKSKGSVLASEGTVRIPHAGDWPGRTKLVLGIR